MFYLVDVCSIHIMFIISCVILHLKREVDNMFKRYTIKSVWESILLVEITRTISIARVRSNSAPCFSSWLSILRHVDNYNFLWYFLCNTVPFYKFVLAKEKRRAYKYYNFNYNFSSWLSILRYKRRRTMRASPDIETYQMKNFDK